MRRIHDLVRRGRVPAAIEALGRLERENWNDPLLLQAAAECYTYCAKHADAWRCNSRAASLRPDDSKLLYNAATAAVAVGRIEEAEALFSRVIELDPRDFDAWQNRSTLRRQTPQDNHVEALQQVLAGITPGAQGEAALRYALAKELEDLGEFEQSFACLQRGAQARRCALSYRVDMDLSAIEQIRNAFHADLLRTAPLPSAHPGPIFILGLPRSGTTLVDRIVSSHSAVESLGELNDLAFAIVDTVGTARDKTELIHRTAQADFPAIGREYLRRLAGYESAAAYVIDKTPLNFLYLGIIRLALPNAKIIHLRRHPLDSGYAMYKTLFRMGYPFSYDLEDLGRYIAAYRGLMEHWRAALPGGFLDVDYEALVQDQLGMSRRILEWCGLEWEPQCEAFHLNPTPAPTASAAQVREPIHARSVGSWRRYEKQLEPLARTLRNAGVLTE